MPGRFWVYAAFAVVYGICETMNGNWSQLEMTTRLGASATQASLALAAFWGMVTVGRVLFGLINRWLPARITYHILPFVVVGAFVLVRVLPAHDATAGIAVFGLAGLGCLALLPLTISFGEEELTAVSAAVAGGVIAFYQLGYGIAAFGVGPLQHAGLSLSAIFGGTALVAAALAVLSFVVSPGAARPAPRPGHYQRRLPGALKSREGNRHDYDCRAAPQQIRSTIPARLDRLRWSPFHTRMVLGLGTAWILDGLSITVASSVTGVLTQPNTLGLTTTQAAATGSVYLLGEVAGALVFGNLCDKLGRRRLFIWTLGIYLIGAWPMCGHPERVMLLTASAPSIE